VLGEYGNALSWSISFELGTPTLVDVRDDLVYIDGNWLPSPLTIGVRVVCSLGSLTVAALETAIAAGTDLATITGHDPHPADTIDIATLNGQIIGDVFLGGTFTTPNNEALKLTSLGIELGIEPGLYRRLPAAQQR